MGKTCLTVLTVLCVVCIAQTVLAEVTNVSTMDASWSVSDSGFSALDSSWYPTYSYSLESYTKDAASVPDSVVGSGSGTYGISSVFAASPSAAEMDYAFSNGASNGTADYSMNASGGTTPTSASAMIEAMAYAQKDPSNTYESFMSYADISNILMPFTISGTNELVFDFDAAVSTDITQSGPLSWGATGQFTAGGVVSWYNASVTDRENWFFNLSDVILTETGSDTMSCSLNVNPYDPDSDFYGYDFGDGFTAASGRINLWFGVFASAYEYGPVDDPGEPNPIPAPGALFLGGIGVSAVGWFRRRRAL